jgi:hypothetical protein
MAPDPEVVSLYRTFGQRISLKCNYFDRNGDNESLLSMALIRQVHSLMASATLAEVTWALAGSELGWPDSVMPGWVRGRMSRSRSC